MTDDELSLEEQIERAQAQPGIAVVVEVIGQCQQMQSKIEPLRQAILDCNAVVVPQFIGYTTGSTS